MYKQLIATAQTLDVGEPSDMPLMKQFSHQMTEQEAFVLALSFVDLQDQDVKSQLIKIKDSMQEQIDSLDQIKKQTFQTYQVDKQIQKCAHQLTCNEDSEQTVSVQSITSFNLHISYVDGLSTAVSICLNKVSLWRSQMKTISQKQAKSSKMNVLFLKKYNIQNYLQQLNLVRDMNEKVKYRLNEDMPDFKYFEQMANRRLVPYKFYHNYSLKNCCKVIVKRMDSRNLILMKQSTNTINLLNYMSVYFFKQNKIYAKCQQFITMTKYMRVINQYNITIENGFMYLFKSFFIDILCEVKQIDSDQFLKVRSIMQCCQQTIDIWRDFQQIKIQSYCLWYYQQFQWLKNEQLIHLDRIRQILDIFKMQYSWIRVVVVKNNQIQGDHNFINNFIKSAIIKIISPILGRLYCHSIAEDKMKQIQKYKREFEEYWIYLIFFKYKNLYRFIQDNVKQLLQTFDSKKFQIEDDRQVNSQQYFLYYKQLPKIIAINLDLKDIGSEFDDFWSEISAFDSLLFNNNQTTKNNNKSVCELKKHFEFYYRIQLQQANLHELLKVKKIFKNQQIGQEVYGLLMNLNFVSSKFFLLKKAAKLLGKKVQRQIDSVRQVAYRLLFR